LETENEGTNYVSDRGIDSIAYSIFYVDESFGEELLQTTQAKECIERYKRSLIFLIEPKSECIKDDGTRMISQLDEAKAFTEVFHSLFKKLNITYHTIDTADLEERALFVENLIRK
jgi:nicotinamide riboside kinase